MRCRKDLRNHRDTEEERVSHEERRVRYPFFLVMGSRKGYLTPFPSDTFPSMRPDGFGDSDPGGIRGTHISYFFLRHIDPSAIIPLDLPRCWAYYSQDEKVRLENRVADSRRYADRTLGV